MPAPRYRAPSVGRALAILEQVAASTRGLGISELARRLDLSKGTVFGLCGQLEEAGALVRDPKSKRYLLGPFVAALASRGQSQARLRDAAGPELTRLRDNINESIFLGILNRGEVVVLDARQPVRGMGIAAGPGTRLPLTAGAVGRVLLAGLAPARVEAIIADGLTAFTPHSITDPARFRAELEEVRHSGLALERDQYLEGVWGAAASLGAPTGLPAALYAVGFTSALTPGRLEEVGWELGESARRIGNALGQS